MIQKKTPYDYGHETGLVVEKDDHILIGNEYIIAYESIDTPERILAWVCHLSTKPWVTTAHCKHLIERLSVRCGLEIDLKL